MISRRTALGAVAMAIFMARGLVIAGEPTPAEVFERRIVPIFKSPDPSSCVQCHLAGVDLKHYIRPSHEETFRSLRDQGLIDLGRPDDSKILRLIQMGDGDKSGATLIHAKTRKAEYDAFRAWVIASAADPKLRDAPKLDTEALAKPPRPNDVIRHGRTDRLLESFERNVWAWRFRCMSCHTEGTKENDKHKQKHGERVAWVKAGGAEATMRELMKSGLVDTAAPEKSLLLQKPLGAIEHGGGTKFLPGDQAYKGFRSWLEENAAVANDRYAKSADLPREPKLVRFGTDAWLKVGDTPEDWGDRLLQVNVYAWDGARGTWDKDPVATSDRGVWGKGRLWQHNLTLVAAPGSERAKQWMSAKPTLPRGRYLIRIFVDREGRLARDWKAELGEADFVGQAEITSAWPEGYGRMTTIQAAALSR